MVSLSGVLGAAFLTMVIAYMFELVTMLNRNQAVYAAHLDQLKYWLELKNIPRRTQVARGPPAPPIPPTTR